MTSKRQFVVTSVRGHCDVTTFSDLGPRFVEVMVSAENHRGEHIEFRRLLDNQPHVGEVVEFGEDLPESAVMSKDLP